MKQYADENQWDAAQELLTEDKDLSLVENDRSSGWRLTEADLSIAKDVCKRVLELLGLSKLDFAIWRLVPLGTRMKTGPRLFNRQIGSSRDLLSMSIQAGNSKRAGHDVEWSHWLRPKVDYAADSVSVDCFMEVGLKKLLELEPLIVTNTRYRPESDVSKDETFTLNEGVHRDIADVMAVNGIDSYAMLMDVYTNQDLDFEGKAATYNRGR